LATVSIQNYGEKNTASVGTLSDSSSFTGLNKIQPIKISEGTGSDTEVGASGFQQNRFMFEGVKSEDRTSERDAKYIVSNLTGITGYLASYCDWWMIRWHQCFHDEGKGCSNWKVLDSSDSYSEYENVPDEVPQ